MILRVSRSLLLVIACGVAGGWDERYHHHRLDLRPHVALENPSQDDEIPSHLLHLPIPHKAIYHNRLDPLYVGTYPSRMYSFDDVEFNRRCLPCPSDVKIVARRRSLTAAFSPPAILPSTCPEVSRESVIVHINRGPIPHEQLGPGLYPVFLTAIHYGTATPRRAVQCHYIYEVIVNKCSPLNTADGRVKVVCSHENAWGSNCTSSCPSGYKREGFARTRCRNNLTWSHGLPKCRLKKKGPCKLTAFNGVFQCTNGEDLESNEYVSSGTVCRLRCSEGWHIPRRQKHLAHIRCSKGRWNTTADPLCVPIPGVTRPTRKTLKVNKPRYSYVRKKSTRSKPKLHT